MASEVRLIDMRTLWQCETCFHHYPNGCDTYCDHGESYRPAADKLTVIDPESLRPKGRWVVNRKSFDGYTHHRCSHCGTDAPFVYTYIDEWDEDLDGEWEYIGQRENGIEEQMGSFCPNCGADMREEK